MSTIASSNQISRQDWRYRNPCAWRAVREWCQRQSTVLSPGPEARRGALWGTLLVVAIFAIEDVIFQPSGFGLALDVGFAIALTVAVITVITLVVALFIVTVRQLPVLCTGVLLGASVLIMIASVGQPSMRLYLLALGFCLAGAVMGGAVATIKSNLRNQSSSAEPQRTSCWLLPPSTASDSCGFSPTREATPT